MKIQSSFFQRKQKFLHVQCKKCFHAGREKTSITSQLICWWCKSQFCFDCCPEKVKLCHVRGGNDFELQFPTKMQFVSKPQNLDALHDHLGTLYPGMRAPSFRCTEEPDGSLILHYYSDRPGLENIVIGIVKVSQKEEKPQQLANEWREIKAFN